MSHYALQVAPRLSPEEDYQRVLKLLFDIRNSNSKSTMPPVVNIVDVNRFRTRPIPAVPSQTGLPDECEEFDLPYSFECDVTTYPLPITKRCSGLFSSVQDAGYEEEKNRFISPRANWLGENIFGTIENCSRHGLFEPLRVNYRAKSGSK